MPALDRPPAQGVDATKDTVFQVDAALGSFGSDFAKNYANFTKNENEMRSQQTVEMAKSGVIPHFAIESQNVAAKDQNFNARLAQATQATG